jgi:hypothetical protein
MSNQETKTDIETRPLAVPPPQTGSEFVSRATKPKRGDRFRSRSGNEEIVILGVTDEGVHWDFIKGGGSGANFVIPQAIPLDTYRVMAKTNIEAGHTFIPNA